VRACGRGQTDRETHRRAWTQYISRRLRLTRNVVKLLTVCVSSGTMNSEKNQCNAYIKLFPTTTDHVTCTEADAETMTRVSGMVSWGYSGEARPNLEILWKLQLLNLLKRWYLPYTFFVTFVTEVSLSSVLFPTLVTSSSLVVLPLSSLRLKTYLFHKSFLPWTLFCHCTASMSYHPDCVFWARSVFWATLCKTVCPMLSDRCPVCLSVCPVCDVCVLWSNGWLDQDAT